MEEKRNVPKLRFPGFTDPWEQRKLGELVEETYGGGTPKTSVPEYWGGDIPWIQSSNVIEGELFNIDIPKAITDKGLRESAAILIPGSSIAVVTHVGVGKLVYLPFSFTTSQDFVSLSRLKTNSIFLCYALFRRLQTEINMVQGSAIKGITKAELLDKRIDIPHDVEQTQIGAFFQKLDSLIALHQRELDHVKELKKGLLQKMFPKEGTNAPELRFPGFTDPWEQRRLGEVVDVHDGVHQTPDYKDHGVMFVSVEDIETLKSEKYISKEDYDRDYKTRPATGDILMTRIGDVGTSNVVETHDEMAFYVSLALLKPRNIESYFLNSAIKSSFFQKRLQERTLVTAVPMKINKDEIGKVEILLPVAIEEQRQIGAFFRSLDSLIALHQRELDHVKELKKGLLQQMFV